MKRRVGNARHREGKFKDFRSLYDTPPWEWPEDVGHRIIGALARRTVSEPERLIAAELAGNLIVMNDAVCEALLSVAGSSEESAELRAQAVISFGAVLEEADICEFDSPDDVSITEDIFLRVQRELERLHGDESVPKLVRRRALEASVRAVNAWHEPAIQQAYASEDREWMLTAAFCMGYVPGFDKAILKFLKSSDAEIRYEAILAAGEQEVDAAWAHLVKMIADDQTPKKELLAVIGAVGSIRPKEAAEILAPLAASDDPEIAEAVSDALQMCELDFDFDEDEED